MPEKFEDIDKALQDHLAKRFEENTVVRLAQRFKSKGIIVEGELIPPAIKGAVKEQVLWLLDNHAERRDLRLATTGNTPRRMSVVQSEAIDKSGGVVGQLYRSATLRGFLQAIAGERLAACPSKDEEFFISRHEKAGDTHGWHWGDYSFALIWIIETPPIDLGGMLQCVPHTRWDKSNPRIHQYLCDNPIDTYGFKSGDIYFLRTDTTLHRTIPLTRDTTRIILNLTWGSSIDLTKELKGDDRWWDNPNASAVKREAAV